MTFYECIKIDARKYDGCGICVEFCPVNTIILIYNAEIDKQLKIPPTKGGFSCKATEGSRIY